MANSPTAASCSSSSHQHHQQQQQQQQVPLLMLPDCYNKYSRNFIHAYSNTHHEVMLPESLENRCYGSSHGWLIMVDNETSQVNLLHPLTKQEVELPYFAGLRSLLKPKENKFSLSSSCDQDNKTTGNSVYLHKLVLSSDPVENPHGFVAMGIFGPLRKLAFCKLGDRTWTLVQGSKCFYDDVLYYYNKFFAVDECGGLFVCDLGSWPTVIQVTTPWFFQGNKVYLAATDWGLLLIVRYIADCPSLVYKTTGFQVYQLDELRFQWVRIRDLDNWILFLGQNHSMAVSTHGYVDWRGDCIYFTDDCFERHVEGVVGGHDVGIFDLNDGTVQLVPHECPGCDPKSSFNMPTWVTLF